VKFGRNKFNPITGPSVQRVAPAGRKPSKSARVTYIPAISAARNAAGNESKPNEVFRDSRRRNLKTLPLPLPDIIRESSLKILNVAFSNNLSASDHIRRVVSESAQTLYAL